MVHENQLFVSRDSVKVNSYGAKSIQD